MPDPDTALDDEFGDELLRLLFTACHPLLSREARAALALRMICGLTTEEIARAFLIPEATVAQRIVRAKRTLADEHVPFEVPRLRELGTRIGSVLEGPPRATGHELIIPLHSGLANGVYSVRWSVVSNDGHLERGVLAFAVGPGQPKPESVLGASVPLTWTDLVLRSLYYLGLLSGGGAAVFGSVLRLHEPTRRATRKGN